MDHQLHVYLMSMRDVCIVAPPKARRARVPAIELISRSRRNNCVCVVGCRDYCLFSRPEHFVNGI